MTATSHDVYQTGDGRWSIGWHDDAPSLFSSRSDAVRIANAEKPTPAPVATPRHFKIIREVRCHAE